MPHDYDEDNRSGNQHRARAGRSPASMPAKLARPRPHLVTERARLFSLLDPRCQNPLIWISGPPGAGKTTLVAICLRARKLPGLWHHHSRFHNSKEGCHSG